MAKHAHTTTPDIIARTSTRPAAGSVLDRRDARQRAVDTLPIPHAMREAIERNIEAAIDYLNDLDGEIGNDDCCEAGDDDPASSCPVHGASGCLGKGCVGDPDDAEESGDDEPDDDREVTDADEGEESVEDVTGLHSTPRALVPSVLLETVA